MNKLIELYILNRKLLAEALVEKDYMMLYEAEILKNEFVAKLGEPRYELHKLELAIARNKLKLEMIETCEKFKIPIDFSYIDRELEKEFKKHYEVLKKMRLEIEYVHSIDYAMEKKRRESELEMKEIYLEIASYIHPELEMNQDKSKKRTWKTVEKAYKQGDIEKLKKLHKKVIKDFAHISEKYEDLEKQITAIKERREAVQNEIQAIRNSFPFSESDMLDDEVAVMKFRDDMDTDIRTAKEVLDKLEKKVLEKLPPMGKYIN
ncbi:hypothetical protein [Ruminiclostridium josui]|uniref:hypothetical protein n=1 Tax=Ruminiclostridium josui TaxID=1499 RepID=UPI000464A67E|nr:hypothetical protein [Ruminiclostridium josui]